MAPLGLRLAERPEVRLEPRGPTMPGDSARMRGPMVTEGQRHGRRVSVRREDGATEVLVAAPSPQFATKASDGRLGSGRDDAIRDALEAVPASTRWNGVRLRGGPDGIVVERRRGAGAGDWLCDLWLAERVAEGLG
jgi:hypothetical protein